MAYSIHFKQCSSDHMARDRPHRRALHSDARLRAQQRDVLRAQRGQGASAHYFVDDITPEIYQSVAEGDTAWHAGDWQMNRRAFGIEIVSAGEGFSATEVEKLGWLVRKLMAKYGIGASGVIRHYDVTGKLCPAPYVAASKWAALKAAITGGGASGGTTATAPSSTVAELARRVIAGEFGNGNARRAALGSRYPEVQAEVNRILAGGSGGSATQAPTSDDVDDLARRVIAGEFGNGAARKARFVVFRRFTKEYTRERPSPLCRGEGLRRYRLRRGPSESVGKSRCLGPSTSTSYHHSRLRGPSAVRSSIKRVWVTSSSSANSSRIAFSMAEELAIMSCRNCFFSSRVKLSGEMSMSSAMKWALSSASSSAFRSVMSVLQFSHVVSFPLIWGGTNCGTNKPARSVSSRCEVLSEPHYDTYIYLRECCNLLSAVSNWGASSN